MHLKTNVFRYLDYLLHKTNPYCRIFEKVGRIMEDKQKAEMHCVELCVSVCVCVCVCV
jgi:hypothetical protein